MMRQNATGRLVGLGLLVLVALALGSTFRPQRNLHAAADDANDASAPRLFEMRTYIAHDGKFEALHKRFREHTTKLFAKHGMTNIGYWTPTEGPGSENTLVYLLAYPSREAREASWKAFMADPEWQAVYKESHKDGPLVSKVESRFLAPTDYSAIK
ncbi:MAG: NIPSNAP family protein [Planctomycetaceae bacterium]|nr:NIPSNAP family protein [Planctomycetaceae bacterium]